ncbi:hypothetical protein SDC9_190015 [bioreactor metagenome]|uniref:Uncharacterized protein n=1 Tax=bioreactor metagenome TaxID=1076179 RepID=A0A645HTU1_9ZZZZ
MHRPLPRRCPAAAPQGTPVAQRRASGRSTVLFHHLRLDDVELAGLRPGLRGDAAPLRRLAVRRGRHGAVRLCGGRTHDPFRHLGEIHRRSCQDGPDAGQDPRSRRLACHVLDRQPAVAGRLRLGLSRNQAGHPACLDFRRDRHHFLLRARQSGTAGLPRRTAVPRTRHGGRRL